MVLEWRKALEKSCDGQKQEPKVDDYWGKLSTFILISDSELYFSSYLLHSFWGKHYIIS